MTRTRLQALLPPPLQQPCRRTHRLAAVFNGTWSHTAQKCTCSCATRLAPPVRTAQSERVRGSTQVAARAHHEVEAVVRALRGDVDVRAEAPDARERNNVEDVGERGAVVERELDHHRARHHRERVCSQQGGRWRPGSCGQARPPCWRRESMWHVQVGAMLDNACARAACCTHVAQIVH